MMYAAQVWRGRSGGCRRGAGGRARIVMSWCDVCCAGLARHIGSCCCSAGGRARGARARAPAQGGCHVMVWCILRRSGEADRGAVAAAREAARALSCHGVMYAVQVWRGGSGSCCCSAGGRARGARARAPAQGGCHVMVWCILRRSGEADRGAVAAAREAARALSF